MALSLAEDVETRGAFPPESRPSVQIWVKSTANAIPGLQSRQQTSVPALFVAHQPMGPACLGGQLVRWVAGWAGSCFFWEVGWLAGGFVVVGLLGGLLFYWVVC